MDFPYGVYSEPSGSSTNSGFFGKFKPFSNMKLISLISWLLLAITSIISFFKPSLKPLIPIDEKIFWLTFSIQSWFAQLIFPLIIMHYYLYYTCFTLMILSCVAGFCIMAYYMFKDERCIDGMFERYSKFHFIPILCVSALFIIGEFNDWYQNTGHLSFIFDLILDLVGLCSLLMIYTKTDLNYSKVAYYTIKQGTYGCLIPLLVYNFCFGFSYYGLKIKDGQEMEKYSFDFAKNCYIIFTILIGIINLGLSFAFKNIVIAFMNLLMYVGLLSWFFYMSDSIRNRAHGITEGLIDILIIAMSGFLIFILYAKYKSQIMLNNVDSINI